MSSGTLSQTPYRRVASSESTPVELDLITWYNQDFGIDDANDSDEQRRMKLLKFLQWELVERMKLEVILESVLLWG